MKFKNPKKIPDQSTRTGWSIICLLLILTSGSLGSSDEVAGHSRLFLGLLLKFARSFRWLASTTVTLAKISFSNSWMVCPVRKPPRLLTTLTWTEFSVPVGEGGLRDESRSKRTLLLPKELSFGVPVRVRVRPLLWDGLLLPPSVSLESGMVSSQRPELPGLRNEVSGEVKWGVSSWKTERRTRRAKGVSALSRPASDSDS